MNVIETLAVKLVGETSEFASSMSEVGGKLKELGSNIKEAGETLTARITLPLVAIGALSIKAASDLNESMNKVDVVFGQSATSVQAWATTAAESFGQSQRQALEAAGTFGNLFTTMGMGVEESAKMSMGLVELASDLASFNNIDPTVALEKLRAGLVGEVEPLRTLGINLSAAAVQAKAMEMGLADANGQLSQSALAQARYALILEQSKNAQGDFARTSDGLANSQRILKAELADAAAQLGQQLLPYALKAVQAITSLVKWFSDLSPATQRVIVVIAGVAAVIGPLLIVIGSLISAVGAIMAAFSAAAPVITAVGGVIAALGGPITIIIAVVAALAAAWATNFWGIRDVTYSAIGAARDFIGSAVNSIRNFFSGSWSDVGQRMMQGIADGIRGAWQWVVDAATGAASAALNAAKAALGIASPSQEGLKIGLNFGEAIGMGANRAIGALSADITGRLDSALSGVRLSAQSLSPAGAGAGGNFTFDVRINFGNDADPSGVAMGVKLGITEALRQVGLQ